MQYDCPTEYNISKTYYQKEHHLRCPQVEPLGTGWNQKRTDTKCKTLISQYCVYNIISLQNITLKIRIARKSSILDLQGGSRHGSALYIL